MKRLLYILAFLPLFGFSQWNDCPKNDIMHDQWFKAYEGIPVNQRTGYIQCNNNCDTITKITYSIASDTSGLFGIAGDSLYFVSVTGLQTSVTYWIQFKGVNGSVSDTANGYVYIIDADSLIKWNGQYDSFDAGYYYWFKRDSTYSIDTTINIDANKVKLFAKGYGDYPILNCNYDDGSSQDFFGVYGDDVEIRELEMRTNGKKAYLSTGVHCYNYVDRFISDDNRWIGTEGQEWVFLYRYDRDVAGYDHRITNDYGEYLELTVGTYMNIHGLEYISNYFIYLGCDDYGGGVPCACNGLMTVDDYDHTEIDARYNYINHSHHPNKEGFNLSNNDGIDAFDTIVKNRIIGPGVLNGILGYGFTGIGIDGHYVYVGYNEIDSVERGFTGVVPGHTMKHIRWEDNIIRGARQFGILIFSYQIDSSYVLHNTFTDPNFSEGETYYVVSGNWTAQDTIANNIFDISDGQNVYQDEDAIRMYNIYTDLTGTGYTKTATEIEGDPLFVNKAAGDLTLQVGSPAIDAGYDFGVVYDFAGNVRNDPPDIGAYEYQEEEEPPTSTITKLDGKIRVTKLDGRVRIFLKPK